MTQDVNKTVLSNGINDSDQADAVCPLRVDGGVGECGGA